MSEEWREVPGFPGYRVSSHGRVIGRKGKLLKQSSTRTGHLTIALGSKKTIGVHVAVALAFIGPRPANTVCCHNDGNPLNNVPDNLRWDSKAADCRDRRSHGRDTVGERNGQAKLTVTQVKAIRTRYAEGGISFKKLGALYGVSADTAHSIVQRTLWKSVP